MTVFIQSKYAQVAVSQEYINLESFPIIVDKMVFKNNDVNNWTFTVNIVPAGGSPDNSNQFINRLLNAGASDLCPEIIGQDLGLGDSIWVSTTTAATVAMKCTGRVK